MAITILRTIETDLIKSERGLLDNLEPLRVSYQKCFDSLLADLPNNGKQKTISNCDSDTHNVCIIARDFNGICILVIVIETIQCLPWAPDLLELARENDWVITPF